MMTKCKILIVLMVLLSATLEMNMVADAGSPQVPCFFIFGDSLSDSGNNNRLPVSAAKADYLPYGIDFPNGPTGRFCNGKNMVDFIGDFLGLDGYIPSFPKSQMEGVLKGVNYASASAGIFNHTGFEVGQNLCIDKQLMNHETTISRMRNLMGNQKNATNHLNQCLYSVFIGYNDWMLDYFNPTAGGSAAKYPPTAFADMIVSKFTEQLTALHGMGARKVMVFGLSPLGCAPPLYNLGKCTEKVNDAMQIHNGRLRALVDKLNAQFKDSQFIFIDPFNIFGKDLSGLGLPVKYTACCLTVGPSCVPLSVPCEDRNTHVYWDIAHTTEAANKVFATRAFHALTPNDTHPMDISHLVALKL